jgi:membrane-associated phospholipid phosphatase
LPNLPWDKRLRKLGLASEDVWLLTAVAGSFAYGTLSGDERSKRAALLSSKALVYSFATTQIVLKSIIGRKRPCGDLDVPNCSDGTFTDNPLEFGNFHGISIRPEAYGTAMPSYHFTQYFAVARVYSGVYGDSWVPYGLATLLATSNIRGHRHWVSDMVAGTVIGLGIGEVVLRNSRDYRAGTLTATPLFGNGSKGLSLEMKF